MKGEMDLDDHHALCQSYRDLVFYLPALSHLVRAGALCGNRCKGKEWALLRGDGANASAMSGEIPRLALSLWLTIPVVPQGDSYRSEVASAMDVGESGKP